MRGSDGAATRRIKEVWTPPMLVTRSMQGGDRYYSFLAASNVSGEGEVAYSGRSGPVKDTWALGTSRTISLSHNRISYLSIIEVPFCTN
jgi:hypothetical protein